MDDMRVSRDEFKNLLEHIQANGSKEERAIAKDYLKHFVEQEKVVSRRKYKATKILTAHELIVKLTEMLEAGSQLAGSLKHSTELPYSQEYKELPEDIKKSIGSRKVDLAKYRKAFNEWYIETANAIVRYEKNTYHLRQFMRNRDSYAIITEPKDTPEDLLADFGHHIQELVEILRVLERQDTTLTVSLSFHGSDVPKVTVGDEFLYFKSMRNGNAYALVSFCLNQHPEKLITLDEFKNKYKLALEGVTNINQVLKNSPFDKNQGLLRVFVESSPQSLKVKPTINITPEYLDNLRDNAVEPPQDD